jgi:hypothetical protein
MNRFIAKISTVAVLGLAAVARPGPGPGGPGAPAQMPSVLARIPVGDLDLSRPDDARLLKARIETAGRGGLRRAHPGRAAGPLVGGGLPHRSSATRCSSKLSQRPRPGPCARRRLSPPDPPSGEVAGAPGMPLPGRFIPQSAQWRRMLPAPKGDATRLPPIHHGLGTRSCGVSPDFAPSQAVGDTPRGHVPGWGVDAQRIANRVKRNQSLELFRPFLSITLPAGRIMLAPESTGRAHVRRPLRLSGVDEREALAGGL